MYSLRPVLRLRGARALLLPVDKGGEFPFLEYSGLSIFCQVHGRLQQSRHTQPVRSFFLLSTLIPARALVSFSQDSSGEDATV